MTSGMDGCTRSACTHLQMWLKLSAGHDAEQASRQRMAQHDKRMDTGNRGMQSDTERISTRPIQSAIDANPRSPTHIERKSSRMQTRQ
eukprot:3082256-Rhodomonas_salina.4